MENNAEVLQAAVDKLSFVSEIIKDWTVDPGVDIFDTWSEETRIKVFAGIHRTLEETAAAVATVHEELANVNAQAFRENSEEGES